MSVSISPEVTWNWWCTQQQGFREVTVLQEDPLRMWFFSNTRIQRSHCHLSALGDTGRCSIANRLALTTQQTQSHRDINILWQIKFCLETNLIHGILLQWPDWTYTKMEENKKTAKKFNIILHTNNIKFIWEWV